MRDIKVKLNGTTKTIRSIFAKYKICAEGSIPMYDYWVKDSNYHVVYTVGSDGYLRDEITTQKTPTEYYTKRVR